MVFALVNAAGVAVSLGALSLGRGSPGQEARTPGSSRHRVPSRRARLSSASCRNSCTRLAGSRRLGGAPRRSTACKKGRPIDGREPVYARASGRSTKDLYPGQQLENEFFGLP